MSRLRPVGTAAAVVQFAGINKAHDYQSAIPLLVIEFKFLEGRGGKLVVKELPALVSPVTRSHRAFKCPYSWEEVPALTPE